MSNKHRQQQHSKQAVTAAVPGGANRDGVEASALVAGPSSELEASADSSGVSIQLEGLEVTQVYEVSLKNVETSRVRAVDEAAAIEAYFKANGIIATDHVPSAIVSGDQEGLAIGDEFGESRDDQG